MSLHLRKKSMINDGSNFSHFSVIKTFTTDMGHSVQKYQTSILMAQVSVYT